MVVEVSAAAHVRRARRRRGWRASIPAYLFIAPSLLGVAVFVAFPVVFALYMSFQDWNGIQPPHFVGWSNFQALLVDPLFWHSLEVTAAYTALTVPTLIVVSLAVALLLRQRVRGMAFFRTAMFIPVVTSALAVGVIWKWILDYDNGLINDVLTAVNLPQVPWLSDPVWALIGLAIIGVWKGFGLTAVILLAALQGVPETLLEAASIDGAGAWRRFWSIMLPMIAPGMLFVAVITLINSFQVFDQVYYITNGQGGPDYGTLVLNLLVFQRAFQQNHFGAASALAYILFAIIFVVTVAQLRLGRRASNAVAEIEV